MAVGFSDILFKVDSAESGGQLPWTTSNDDGADLVSIKIRVRSRSNLDALTALRSRRTAFLAAGLEDVTISGFRVGGVDPGRVLNGHCHEWFG